MKHRRACSVWSTTLVMLATLAVGHRCSATNPRDLAGEILEASGVQGGLVVHVGCGDGKMTGALRASDSFLVHGLDEKAGIATARQHLQETGLYGRVSIESWSGTELPYIDKAVNLLVIRDDVSVARDEILRVLCPGGSALTVSTGNDAEIIERFTKPKSDEVDDWTHYLHDATGNAVAQDTVVGPPKHLQWVGSPTWTRHHDHISSFHAMVSAGGRVFYLMDEGPRAEIQLPPEWKLSARDAWNGTLLWQRSIDLWHTHLWPLKSGPAQLPRRLVAVDNRVYVTLGLNAPISVLDAATGETIRILDGTAGTEEILHDDGQLLAVVQENPFARPWATRRSYSRYDQLQPEPEAWSWKTHPRAVMALDEATGEILWKRTSSVAPLSLTTDGVRVFFHDGTKVVCLDKKAGQPLWSSEPIKRAADMRSWFAPTLVVHEGVVVFAGGEAIQRHRGGKDTMTALSAETGEVLWTAEHPPSGYDSPEDVLIVDGLVWTAPITNRRETGLYTGRDLRTGEVKRTFPADDGDHMPHHRCHRAKATERFLLTSRTGIEYVDLQAEHWNRNDWVRGACLYGIMPANGLTYAPPQSCACYIVSKLNGLNALAPARAGDSAVRNTDSQLRFQKGPAYAPVVSPSSSLALRPSSSALADWPTYRSDAARTGWAKTSVPISLSLTWQADIGGRLSSPVIAGGRVFVASIDRHTVHALDQRTGKQLWQATAGARVDSPPTVWRDRVLFGSRDGWIYCLRAEDGALAWRYRAAPGQQRLVAFEQVESVWPVHGSVLVQDGIVHCVAGRSMFLDGGMHYVRLDGATGKLLSETVLDDRHPETGEPLDAEIRWPNLPVALPDILSSDGESVYMRSQRFDLQGRRVEVAAASDFRDQTGEGAHLFATTGFLDDSWWHRTYWMYGKNALGGAGGWYLPAYRAPTGRIMVFDDAQVFAFDRQPQYYPKTTALEYHLYAADKQPEIVGGRSPAQAAANRNRPTPSRPAYDWSYQTPLLGRALVLSDRTEFLSDRTLFVAGPPDLVNQEQTITSMDDPETQKKLAEQAAAWAGQRGALLMAVSADDGRQVGAWGLPSPPVFDGMAAAWGQLFLSTMDGCVICLGSTGEPLPPAPGVRLMDRPEPKTVVSNRRETVEVTSEHPDFQKLTRVQVDSCELGYCLRTPSGSVGYALRKLPEPLTGKATFKLRLVMLPNTGKQRPPGNGFLAIGAAPDDPQLIKCGLRNAGQVGMIVQGPLMQGESNDKHVPCNTGELTELMVHVDLDRQTIQLELLGQTIVAELTKPLKEITYIGYGVHSVASEFSPIEVIDD